uniref:Uncharacterized protein n=1 Tax=Acrobeloides nanus TaxID=290746 RepID=A0A914EI02_9BILA
MEDIVNRSRDRPSSSFLEDGFLFELAAEKVFENVGRPQTFEFDPLPLLQDRRRDEIIIYEKETVAIINREV